jgi:hypothetical protein
MASITAHPLGPSERESGRETARPYQVSPWRRLIPFAVSSALIAWLAWKVSWSDLLQATAQLDMRLLVPLTAVLVLALYLWDAACVKYVFDRSGRAVAYGVAVRARGAAYSAGAIHYGLGQGVLAWLMADATGLSLPASLARLAVLTVHDLVVLMSLCLAAASMNSDSRMYTLRVVCSVGLLVLGLIGIVVQVRHPAWLGSWNWLSSLQLCALRSVNFGLSLVYVLASLVCVGVHAPWSAACTAVPLIQFAEGIPLTMSGLGTREAILLVVLNPDRPDLILAFGLVWSTGLILGRLAIGVGHLWIRR